MRKIPIRPQALFADFRADTIYRTASAQFFTGRRLAPNVTEEEKRMVFEASDSAKLGLIAFAEREHALAYEPAAFGMAAEPIDRYIDHVRFVKQRMLERPDRDEIMELDRLRARLHIEAAQAMLDHDYAPTLKLGRTLARLILVGLGIETFDDARHMS